MFTGIIECTGKIIGVGSQGSNITFKVESKISSDLKVDQSLAHDGVCLTVTRQEENWHQVDAILETLDRTALSKWAEGYTVNLERAMKLDSRLDGHMVQGHVDTKGRCQEIQQLDGSWIYTIDYPSSFAPLIVPKGSICVNGISLTANRPTESSFQVAIIPYTYNHTNISNLKKGDPVNLEFDILGKYVQRTLGLRSS